MSQRRISWGLLAASSFAGSAAPVAAIAADAPAAAAAEEGGLEQVVVTATRRDETVQKVPMSLQALTADQMEARSIQRVSDVVANTPNVFIGGSTEGSSTPVFSFRGIKQTGGVFIDGVYQMSSLGLGAQSTLELERVEVLRGPQGTLFGRDTTGGAIRLFTKLPATTFGVRAEATVGSYDRRGVSLVADVPLIPATLLTKFTFSTNKVGGFIRSVTVDRAYGDDDQQTIRADILWKPTDNLKVRLTGEHFNETGSQPNYTRLILESSPPGTPIVPGFGFQVPTHEYYRLIGIPFDAEHHVAGYPGGQLRDFQTTADFNAGPGMLVRNRNVTLHLDWNITDSITLSSLSSYNSQTGWEYSNFQGSNVHFFSQGFYTHHYGWQQEFQLSGHQGPLDWLAGLYGYNDTVQQRFMRWAFWEFKQPMNPNAPYDFSQVASSPECTSWTPASGLIPCILVPGSSDTNTGVGENVKAVFGELNYEITSTLKATLGARYHRQKNSDWNYLPSANAPRQSLTPGALPGGDILASNGRADVVSNTFTKSTYHVALTNQFTPQMLGYVSFSQGYNAGGNNRIALPEIDPATGANYILNIPFNPETINNYEIGLKSDWLDHRLRVNLTYFYTQWRDIQVQGTVHDPFTGAELPAFLTANQAAARTTGFEPDITFAPNKYWQFHANAGYLNAKYTKVNPGSEINLNSKFGQAPYLQYSAGAQYSPDMPGGYHLAMRADWNWTAGYNRTYVPGDQTTTYTHDTWDQHAFGLLQARVTLHAPSGKWQVSAFGTNLLNRIYYTGGFFSPLLQVDDGTIGRPREFGLSAKFFVE